MKFLQATIYDVRLPLVHSFQTSSHRKSYLAHLLVELNDDQGSSSWGEIASPSDPFYCSETIDTAWLIAREYLLPAVLGKSWDHPAQVADAMSKVRGHYFAKAGIDVAAWVAYAQSTGQSLSAVLGGTRQSVVAGVSLGIEPTIDELLIQVDKQVSAGYGRVKLKAAPGWDIEPVRAVRDAFPDLDMHIDANAAYDDSEQTFQIYRKLDEFGLTMFEQPFAAHNFLAHARLQKAATTPVCLDESVENVDELRTAIALQSASILNIKVSRMGGLTAAKQAHDIATEAGWPVWCGGMHEFGIGRAANLAISSLPGFSLPSDVSASEKYYARDIIIPPVVADHGVVQVPTGHGLGFAVDRDFIVANTERSESISRE